MQTQTLQNKCSIVDKFMMIKTLGCGYNSKVKLCRDLTTNEYFAIKLIKHSHPKLNLNTIKSEIEILSSLKHPNIVNLVGFYESVDYIKKNGSSYKVVAIVLELVPGGELFEYISSSGRFAEDVARTYFKILIETVEHCHNQSIVHRDLKAENLLMDANFNLKVADFGFSTLLSGKEENGQLYTVLGTESYMAPEIHLKQPYSGPVVDLFACGVILFIMVSGNPPFIKADPKSDGHYRSLCVNRYDTFWEAHERNKPKEPGQSFYSPEFKSLVSAMFALDPAVRPSLVEIKQHPWYNGSTVDLCTIQNEFRQRKISVDEKIQRQRLARREKKLIVKNQAAIGAAEGGMVEPYREMNIDELGQMDTAELKKCSDNLCQVSPGFKPENMRVIKEYEGQHQGLKATTEIFSVLKPEQLFVYLCLACKNSLNEITISQEAYKIKGRIIGEEQRTCELTVEISKVDEEVCCIEFHKKKGDVWEFYNAIEEINSKLPIVEIAEETQEDTEKSLEAKESTAVKEQTNC